MENNSATLNIQHRAAVAIGSRFDEIVAFLDDPRTLEARCFFVLDNAMDGVFLAGRRYKNRRPELTLIVNTWGDCPCLTLQLKGQDESCNWSGDEFPGWTDDEMGKVILGANSTEDILGRLVAQLIETLPTELPLPGYVRG